MKKMPDLIVKYKKNKSWLYKRDWMLSSGLSKSARKQKSGVIVPNLLTLLNIKSTGKFKGSKYKIAGSTANYIKEYEKGTGLPFEFYNRPRKELYLLEKGHRDSDALSPPIGFKKVWDTKLWKNHKWFSHVAIYEMICAPDYVALGHFAIDIDGREKFYEKRNVANLKNTAACVKKSFTKIDKKPMRIMIDFDGWLGTTLSKTIGRTWSITKNKVVSFWQSQTKCFDPKNKSACLKFGNPIFVTHGDYKKNDVTPAVRVIDWDKVKLEIVE